MARPQTPQDILKLRGTWRKDRHGKQSTDAAGSTWPAWGGFDAVPLSDADKAAGDTLAAEIQEAGVPLADIDQAALARLVVLDRRLRSIEAMLDSSAGDTPAALHRVHDRLHDAWLVLVKSFGLTPAARRSMRVAPPPDAPSPSTKRSFFFPPNPEPQS